MCSTVGVQQFASHSTMESVKRQKHLTGFKDSDHDILVKIVKGAQWRKIKGKQGQWEDFVAMVNRKRGGVHSDPAKHPVDVLAAFVQTFTKKEDVDLVKRVRNWSAYCANQKMLNETHPFAKTPEQELVESTGSHPRFWSYYNFQSWMEGWKHAKRGDPNSPVKLISLDCEMVTCEGDVKDLVRVCAVGSDYNTLIDELVVPNGNVTDYLTSITGVSEKDLKGVTLTQADAQKLVLDLLTPGTILVGHSLHHDLRALKIDHKRVIDTALLFRDPSWPPAYCPGLSNLCQAILKYNFRDDEKPHDCLEDAIVPMRLVHYRLEHDVSSLSLPLPRKGVNQEDLSKLLLHMLPNFVPVSSLRSIFPKDSACRIQDIVYKNKGKRGSTVAVFESIEEADNAFEHLEGILGKDSAGYPQKTVTLMYPAKNQMRMAEFQVRKMVNSRSVITPGLGNEESQTLVNSSKRLSVSNVADENTEVAKRRKVTSDASEDLECGKMVTTKSRDVVDEPQSLPSILGRPGPSKNPAWVNKYQLLDQENIEDQELEEGEISEGEVKDVVVERPGKKKCCSHAKDLEAMKLELDKVRKESKSRADEISSLQKLVAALSRREGLA
ncbi:hypothetical protein KC19_8G152400 [Ceratodon purpureus]|uniref:Exonuclease domain-containing protein n=1 Tax=Ceratodon purpureus TaxID=3225 RepID=A0A8T0H2J8_CERPU|nr:hypothetical protein KC19_8G152400 [Ceratodon purpureus]